MGIYPLSIIIICGLFGPTSKWELCTTSYLASYRALSALSDIIINLLAKDTYIDTGTLQIFNGTLTEITCTIASSAATSIPVYRLVDQKMITLSYQICLILR
jgi:hypothetical protein